MMRPVRSWLPTLSVALVGLLLAVAALSFGVVAVGCSGTGEQSEDERFHVVATTGQLADLVRHVAGERVRLTQIMGAGVDPHLYVAREADSRAFERADMILYNGLLLEGRLGDTLRRMGERKPVIAVAEQLPREALLEEPEEDSEAKDPHVWFDPRLWRHAVDVVAEALTKALPEQAEAFAEHAVAYQAELDEAYERLRKQVAGIPSQQRVMITAHDAFQYFGRAFDIEVMGIQGMTTEAEAGVQRREQLVSLIVERRIPAIFIETSVNPQYVEALVEGAAARGHRVEIGGALYSDAMGEPGTATGTYLGMLTHNVTTIVEALSKRS